jgi:hypothetical protein
MAHTKKLSIISLPFLSYQLRLRKARVGRGTIKKTIVIKESGNK